MTIPMCRGVRVQGLVLQAFGEGQIWDTEGQ